MKFPKKCYVALGIAALVLCVAAWWGWTRYLGPTHVAVIKFADFQVAEMMDSKPSAFVRLHPMSMEALDRARLSGYDVLFFFGRGLNFSPEQAEAVRAAQSRGTRVFVAGATNPDADLTDLRGEELQQVQGYFENGGRRNFRALLNYARRVLDGKTLFTEPVTDPITVPLDAMFHLGETNYFETYEAFEGFYKEEKLYTPEAPRVALVTSIIGPRNADRAHVDEIIQRLEDEDLNVYPIAGFLKRLDFLKAVNPNLVVYLPHGRLAPGNSDAMLSWLREQGTPVLTPQELLQPAEEWQTSQQGMDGGILTQSIVMPELDGAIEPFVVSALQPNEAGLNVFTGLPGRMETFISRVKKWLALQQKENAEKRIAIVYLKGPGQNAMAAGGLEVAPSLFNVLHELKAQGYTTGPLPESVEELEARIQREGPLLGPYAQGAFDRFLEEGNPELVPVETYLAWCEAALEPEMYAAVEEEYGPAPGTWLSLAKEGEPFIAVPRVQFGNVVLLPQLLPAIGDDVGKLVHGVKEPPTHPYVASYLWIRYGFEADAMMHFGTHGSLEFSPLRQNALSSFDWPDTLVGDLPHPYVYVINNVGEAIIAKRRSYATTVSHLTPPFASAELYGPMVALQEAATAYLASEEGPLRAELQESIIAGLEETGLHEDLEMAWPPEQPLGMEAVERIHNYLFTVGQAKITQGLYTLGAGYGEEDAVETVRLMHVDTIADARAQLDVAKGLAEEAIMREPAAFAERYREPAFALIDEILNGELEPANAIDEADLTRLADWEAANETMTGDELFAGFLSLGGSNPSIESGPLSEEEQARLQELAIGAAADPKKRDFIAGLADDTSFQRTEMVLQPGGLERAERIARMVPPMREAIETLAQPDVLELVKLMHREDGRARALELINDEGQQAAIQEQQKAAEARKLAVALRPPFKQTLFAASDLDGFRAAVANWDAERVGGAQRVLGFYQAHAGLADAIAEEGDGDPAAIAALLRAADQVLPPAMQVLEERAAALAEAEASYVRTVRTLKDALDSVAAARIALAQSPKAEMDGVLAVLDGRYIPPSPGGDPVINPSSIPTGRNLFSIDAERTPSPQAWKLGQDTAERLIARKAEDTGAPPKKVAVTLWGGDFIKTQGLDLAVVFALLGCEPVRNPRGIVHDVRLLSAEELGRPRVDVVVQTSGQFRDVAASRIFLINKAVELAANAQDGEWQNPVAEGTLAAEERMKAKGLAPIDARKFATARVFGGANGNYGTGIMDVVEAGDSWQSREEVADQYLTNMGAVYTEDNWGAYQPGVFEGALLNTDTLLQPQASNVDGALSLDHVYEFMGGMNAAIASVTGADPKGYINDMRTTTRTELRTVEEAIWQESRTTLLNPKYIAALQDGGASSAEVFAETFRNTFGWNALRPEAIDAQLWDGLNEVYVEDIHGLDMENYFREKNPYALQEMTAVMLETVRKGYWEPDEATVQRIAELHAELVRDHEPGCSGFVCDNASLRELIAANLTPELQANYNDAIDQTLVGAARDAVEGMRLERQTEDVDRLAEALCENQTPIIAVVVLLLFFGGALYYGARRRRHS